MQKSYFLTVPFKVVLRVLFLFFLVSILLVLSFKWINPPITSLMTQRKLTAMTGVPLKHQWVDYENISSYALLAVIAGEDQNFPHHCGLDFDAIQKAIEYNRKQGKQALGASTITQQVAKNLFLWSGRSLVRKGLEAYFALLIELNWSKRRILEVYVNIAEWGDGIFGVQAACKTYFNKPAEKLTKKQAALLAAVLPNPRRYSIQKPSSRVRRKQRWILKQMRQLGGVRYLESF